VIDPTTGKITGYGWNGENTDNPAISPNNVANGMGWIDFDAEMGALNIPDIGNCGTADDKTYASGASFPGSRTLCAPGGGVASPLIPNLPDTPGANVSWQCVGSTVDNCLANRANLSAWQCYDGECEEDDCGKTVEWSCYEGTNLRSQADCIANDKTCQEEECDTCPDKGGGWKEVVP
ncbi:MAG: hypothetical protein QG620_917, partial [Patescibacteria group bacterium]|nr:hypothetical protein [Patescibacteria group bacterium]